MEAIMTRDELANYEATFITTYNCPLNPEAMFEMPPTDLTHRKKGNNVLHFNTQNRPNTNGSSRKFIETHLSHAVRCNSDSEVMVEGVRVARKLNSESKKEGICVEFGFCTGRTINFMAALAYDKKIFGFDSTEGLPKAWEGKPSRFKKGTFAYKKAYKRIKDDEIHLLSRQSGGATMPFIPFTPLENVKLILGEIENTLDSFVKYLYTNDYELNLIHIDTDLFDSCSLIFQKLNNLIVPEKTVVILDEGYNWTGENGEDMAWKESEFKGMADFAKRKGYRINYLAYNYNHQQLALTFLVE